MIMYIQPCSEENFSKLLFGLIQLMCWTRLKPDV